MPDSEGAPEDSFSASVDGYSAEPGAVSVLVDAGRIRIVLFGEIDADLSPELVQAVSDATSSGLPIDVDAAHVTFMDSAGIAFLARLAGHTNLPVQLLGASPAVRFLLEVTRLSELLDVVGPPLGPEDTPT